MMNEVEGSCTCAGGVVQPLKCWQALLLWALDLPQLVGGSPSLPQQDSWLVVSPALPGMGLAGPLAAGFVQKQHQTPCSAQENKQTWSSQTEVYAN